MLLLGGRAAIAVAPPAPVPVPVSGIDVDNDEVASSACLARYPIPYINQYIYHIDRHIETCETRDRDVSKEGEERVRGRVEGRRGRGGRS